MEEQEQDSRKLLITQNFINALEYLIDSDRLKSVVEFERLTGFRQQRISGMKKYLSDREGKGYFANTDHIAIMHEQFGVSLKYLICGEMPILESKRTEMHEIAADVPRAVYENSQIQLLREDIGIIKERQNLLDKKFDFLQEKFTAQ